MSNIGKYHLFSSLVVVVLLSACAQKDIEVTSDNSLALIQTEWKAATRTKYETAWKNRNIVIEGRSMPFDVQVFDKMPDDGYSLYISLHGGGNAPAELNNQQWENQKRLYRPKNAVYVAPRAPYDDWDMWFKPLLDSFYKQIIEMCVAYKGVNPDKVYLMGYSAGGDGVWRMAPRMADSWAAASMMAGHPGDVRLENLRNTPFMIWCGALDSAYNRNKECELRGLVMDSLQNQDSGGYIHETHIVEGKGHWMDRVDTLAVDWMAQYVRNPYPEKIVWVQSEVTRPYFYWLMAPEDELARDKTVRIERHGNVVDISQCDYSRLKLFFNDQMVDLDKDLIINYESQNVFKGRLKRDYSLLKSTLQERGDLRYSFSAVYDFHRP